MFVYVTTKVCLLPRFSREKQKYSQFRSNYISAIPRGFTLTFCNLSVFLQSIGKGTLSFPLSISNKLFRSVSVSFAFLRLLTDYMYMIKIWNLLNVSGWENQPGNILYWLEHTIGLCGSNGHSNTNFVYSFPWIFYSWFQGHEICSTVTIV